MFLFDEPKNLMHQFCLAEKKILLENKIMNLLNDQKSIRDGFV